MNKNDALSYILNSRNDNGVQHAYEMGYDCGMNGANTQNCNITLFSTDEKKAAWERGKADAEKDKK